MLQSAGLIELTSGGTIFSDLADVDEAKSKVKVTALEASLTPTSLPDVAAAVINNDFVQDAGLTFEDAIAQDDPADPNALPYVNIFAARADEADNATYRKLVEIFQTDPERAGRPPRGLRRHRRAAHDAGGRPRGIAREGRGRHEGRQGLTARDRFTGSIATRAGGGCRNRPHRPSPRGGRSNPWLS